MGSLWWGWGSTAWKCCEIHAHVARDDKTLSYLILWQFSCNYPLLVHIEVSRKIRRCVINCVIRLKCTKYDIKRSDNSKLFPKIHANMCSFNDKSWSHLILLHHFFIRCYICTPRFLSINSLHPLFSTSWYMRRVKERTRRLVVLIKMFSYQISC